MQEKNYHFILTGTQLLNAIEYISISNLSEEENVLVLLYDTDYVLKDLKKVLELEGDRWSTIIEFFPKRMLRLNNNNFIRLFSVLYVKFQLRKLLKRPAKRRIIGNFNDVYCKYIAKNNKDADLIVIDDGYGTLDFFESHNKFTSRINYLIEFFLDIRNYKIKPTAIFSRYYDQLKENCRKNNIQLLKNSFLNLKKNVSKKESSGELFFVGYTIVEENILPIDDYISLLLDVKSVVGDFIYIPHRREKKENLERIAKYFKVKNLGQPFELYLYTSKEYPSEIIAFFSTVLFNVHEMYNEVITLKYIKLHNLQIPHIKNIESLYKEIDLIANKIMDYTIP